MKSKIVTIFYGADEVDPKKKKFPDTTKFIILIRENAMEKTDSHRKLPKSRYAEFLVLYK